MFTIYNTAEWLPTFSLFKLTYLKYNFNFSLDLIVRDVKYSIDLVNIIL